MNKLRVSIVQNDLTWENASRNREVLYSKITSLAGHTDLIVLPEMFSTGYSIHAESLAEPMEGDTFQWMRNTAKKLEAVVTGSLIIKEKNKYFNRLIWMTPDGTFQHYDKKHLFTLANEQDYFSPGEQKLIVEYKGWKICPLICYDLRFPVWSRNVENYDLLLYVASWPAKRAEAWVKLLQARAIENQSFTIGVNRVGKDGNELYYQGDSMIIDYSGKPLVHLVDTEAVVTLTIDRQKQEIFREKLAFLNDRDDFSLLV